MVDYNPINILSTYDSGRSGEKSTNGATRVEQFNYRSIELSVYLLKWKKQLDSDKKVIAVFSGFKRDLKRLIQKV